MLKVGSSHFERLSQFNDPNSPKFLYAGLEISPETLATYSCYLMQYAELTQSPMTEDLDCRHNCRAYDGNTIKPTFHSIAIEEVERKGGNLTVLTVYCRGRRFTPAAPCQVS